MVSRDRKRWQWVVERLRRFKNIRFVPNDFLDEEDQLLKEIVEYVIDSLDSEEKIYITRKYFAEERPLHEIHIRNRIIGVKPEGLKRIKFSAYSKIEKALQMGFRYKFEIQGGNENDQSSGWSGTGAKTNP